jgi:GNAT superfamily N-acetyltransferase
VIRHTGGPDALGVNIITYSRLTAANADAVIADQIAHYAALGRRFEWKLYSHDQPPDLLDRLRNHGFEIGEVEALMALDLRATPPALLAPIAADVRRIQDAAGLDDVLAVNEGVWEGDRGWLREALESELGATPDHLSIHMAYLDGRPACSAWIRFSPQSDFASLWGGSTLPEFRGRGLYTSLVARRAQDAIARGYRFLTIDASPMSRPIVAKHGFRLLTYTYECVWSPDTAESA